MYIMLENSEKGYHMVKKACTMMHSLIDNWKPSPGPFRLGKPWRVVIPSCISHTVKRTSKYFSTNTTEVEGNGYDADEV